MGASVFYSDVPGPESPKKKVGSQSSLEKLDQELKVATGSPAVSPRGFQTSLKRRGVQNGGDGDVSCMGVFLGQDQQKELRQQEEISSLVWICTSTKSTSKAVVIDANQPGNILESFLVCSSHVLCIASVPGTTMAPCL